MNLEERSERVRDEDVPVPLDDDSPGPASEGSRRYEEALHSRKEVHPYHLRSGAGSRVEHDDACARLKARSNGRLSSPQR